MDVAERLTLRIRSGDYHVQGLPAERKLAAEIGVSYMTARKAIQKLLADSMLYRLPNGRLAVQHGAETPRGTLGAQIALLVPAWQSDQVSAWNIALEQLRSRFNFACRVVYCAHWDDPMIFNVLRRFDGTFLVPLPDPVPTKFVPDLLKVPRPVAVLDNDWSHLGVRSLRRYPPVFVQGLLDHLASLGHRRIDCLNVQPTWPVVSDRIAQWKIWLAAHGLEGELVDEPVPPYVHTLPTAYDIVTRRIREGKFTCTAMLCVTQPAALAAMRAMLDHGIRPGHDVAVCTVDGEMEAAYFNPSLTALEYPDPKPYLAVCLEWMLGGKDRKWEGPLLLQPADVPVVVRQSTVPDTVGSDAPQQVRRNSLKEGERR
jgi:hypothetical protein